MLFKLSVTYTKYLAQRKTLHAIITRLGADHSIARMARVRDDDRFRYITPESMILPLHPTLTLNPAAPEGEIWLDWGFVEFWKANFCKSLHM
jgi:hypothetical protein